MDTVYSHLNKTATLRRLEEDQQDVVGIYSLVIFFSTFVCFSVTLFLFPSLFPLHLSTSSLLSSLQSLMAAESTKAVIITQIQHKKKYLHIYLLFWLCLLAEARWNPQVSWCDSVVVSHQVLCYKITLKWETELSKASFLRSDFAFISHQSCQ